jgi:hypothetical protein
LASHVLKVSSMKKTPNRKQKHLTIDRESLVRLGAKSLDNVHGGYHEKPEVQNRARATANTTCMSYVICGGPDW